MFMAILKRLGLSSVVFYLFCSTSVFADEVSIREEINQLKARIAGLEQKLDAQKKCMNDQEQCILDQNKKISDYESRLAKFDSDLHRQGGAPIDVAEGLEIGAGATMIVQGTDNSNVSGEEKRDKTDASYSADITIGKEFKEIGGKAFVHLEAGKGAGLEDDLMLYSNVNRDADDSEEVHLTEVWYEQALFKDKGALIFGKLDPTAYFDNNEVANDETTQFLGRIFRNSLTIEFPDNSAGIRMAYVPKEWFEFGYGVFNTNAGWNKIGDHLFNIGQVTFKTNFFNQAGNYRFLGWYNDAPHTSWLETDKTKEGTFGFGLSFDQRLNDIMTAFCRYGWQNPEVYNPNITATDGSTFSLEHSWSAGLQIEGKLWKRENDVLSFAIGQVAPSGDYKESNAALLGKSEGHVETYYRIHVNDHLSISPDFQYIWNPFGKDASTDTDSVFVGGMRAQVDF
jgi:high affinity Mn2+ porin